MPTTPQTLTNDESKRLLNMLARPEGTMSQLRSGIRNCSMMLFMLDAGLRVGELVKLLQSDLLVSGEPVHSLCLRPEITKSKRQRIVPLSLKLQNAISRMQQEYWRTLEWKGSEYAFFAYTADNPLTARQVERIIQSAGVQAFGRKIHPHILRHTFASRLMRTTNIRIVQELLGHSNLASTQIYTHPNCDDLRNAIESIA